MKIVINKSILENVLNSLLNFIEKKDLSQITSHILLIAKDTVLTLKATDYEIGLSSIISNVVIEEEGVATVSGKKFFDIIKILNDTDTILESIDGNMIIKQKKSKFKLPMFNSNEFPSFPEIENKKKFEISPSLFVKSLKKITPAIDTNNPKFELNGCLIDVKSENINFVATDTRRLAITKIENKSDSEISIIIPKKAIVELQKLFFNELDIYLDEKILIAKSSNFKFFTKLINGKFPNYARIIPSDIKLLIELNKDTILEKIRQVSTISNEIKITFNESEIIFESLNSENAEAKSRFDLVTNLTEEIYIKTNSRYIIDFLSQIESNRFILGFNESSVPFVLVSENFKTIIMPITE